MKSIKMAGWAAGLVLFCFAVQAQEGDAPVAVKIDAQPVGQALKVLAQQTGIQLLVDAEAIPQGATAPSIDGSFPLADVLQKLLSSTTLEYDFINARTVSIRPKGAQISAPLKTTRAEGMAPEGKLRIAQAEQVGKEDPGANEGALPVLEEVVVTGTHIRGKQESSSPMITITRDEIEKTGVATVQDLFEDLPQNFAEISVDGVLSAAGGVSGLNTERASGISLRGLGPGSTLTLLNGKRRPGALDGRVFDISAIPLSVIERVEIVTGGRSAIYGSDAVAGVVNLMTRREFTGAESQLFYGDSVHPGGEQFQLSQIYGQAHDRGGFVVAYDYATDQALDFVDTGLLVPGNPVTAYTISPHTRHHSGFLSGHLDLTERIEVYTDGLFTTRDTDSHNSSSDPGFTVDVSNAHGSDQYSFDAGARIDLSPSWRLDVSGNRGVVDTEAVSAIAFSGPGFEFSNVFHNAVRTELSSASAVADGPLLSIAAREVRTALGVEYRSESFDFTIPGTLNPERKRNVRSAFGEVLVPITDTVELSLAGRYDEYSDFGGTFNPQFGLIWRGPGGLRVRGSYSEAFRAPDLVDIYTEQGGSVALYADPTAPSGFSAVLQASGGRKVNAEEAQTWSAGFDFEPVFAPWARLSLSYFDIDYEGRLGHIPVFDSTFATLLQEADEGLYPGIVVRNPDVAELDAIIAELDSPILNDFSHPVSTPFDPEGNAQDLLDVFPDLILFDNRLANIAIETVNGLDMTFNADLDSGVARWSFGLNGTYTFNHESAITNQSPLFSMINGPGKPVDLRLRASAGWSRKTYGAWLYLNYTDSYPNSAFAPFRSIPSWTTADLTLRYDGRALDNHGLLQGLTATLSIENLLDEDPPPAGGAGFDIGYDPANADPIGRLISLRLVKRW